MTRLFIRNYHRDTTETDLKGLFGKIGDVEEVYLPKPTVTGIVRNFAVVKVNCTDENVQKYMKALNGSNWNGSRVSIEVAKEYYKDRLDNEIAIRNVQIPIALVPSLDYGEWNAPFISLRVKSNAPCVKVSTIPGSYEKGIVPCGWKGFDSRPKKSSKKIELSTSTSTAPLTTITLPLSSSVAKPESKSKPIEGGGLRKGFGSITIPTVAPKPTIAVAATTTVAGDIGASVHCCIEEHDNTDDLDGIDSRYFEDEYSEPCITADELTEEVLQRERQRAMKVLMDLMLVSGVLPSEDSTGVTAVPSSSTTCLSTKQHQKSNSDGWNSAVIKRFDPLKVATNSTTNNTSDNAKLLVAATPVAGDNYAEINILKDIFYKEGGVGWNENHTDIVPRSETAVVAAVTTDALFLEAEKFGIDVRSSGSETNKMSFNFFGSEEDDPLPLSAASVNNSFSVGGAVVENTESVEKEKAYEDSESLLVKRKEILPPLDLDGVRELGSKFCRVSSVETIKKQWEEQREKLVEDYKKKTRESKKKGISKVTSTAAAAGSSAAASASNSGISGKTRVFKRPSSGSTGGKGRGGVKHSKKNRK